MPNSNYRMVNGRRDYSHVSGKLELPYLVEIQKNSYDWFLRADKDGKLNGGIDETLKEVFKDVTSSAGNIKLEYLSSRLEEPKHNYLECKQRDLTYCSKLRSQFRARDEYGQIQVEEVYMGDIPLMTHSGTFIINGSERVIISQIVRSPGAYMNDEGYDKKGNHIFTCDLIPGRGAYLQFETNPKGRIDCHINRSKKISASVLLHAIGLENNDEILDLFGESEILNATLKDTDKKDSVSNLKVIFNVLKPGEPVTEEGVHKFLIQTYFDARRYDLGRAGRHKLADKLGLYSRLSSRILAEDLKSVEGEVRFPKGHELSKADIDELRDEEFFEKGAHQKVFSVNGKLEKHNVVNCVKVYSDENKDKVCNVLGVDLNLTQSHITMSDIVAFFSYFLNVLDGFGETDDIDNLSNRRVRCVGELLQTHFHKGLVMMIKTITQKMQITSPDSKITPKDLINTKPVNTAVHEFFATDQLSSFMDQTNPLAELTNKRRISALGQGGIARDRAVGEVRDVHHTHYGRICPIETPEGQTIGLINSLASYAKISPDGFIMTPYRHVYHKNGKHIVSEDNEYLTAAEEKFFTIAEANVTLNDNGEIQEKYVVARQNGENILANVKDIDFIDVSPKQIVSVAAACIPFLGSDDTTRALMGANMQRQALPLLRPEAPIVGTGIESRVARDSGLAVVATNDGKVTYVDSKKIIVKEAAKEPHVYELQKFERSNKGTCINQTAIVNVGDTVKKNQIIADGPAMKNGDLALGQNVTIAFMTWNGYNYEDAVIMSERLVKDDTYTSIHIEKYEVDCRDTKLGAEEITREIPNVSEDARKFLDDSGVITVGSEVKEGDILVGKITPRGVTEPTPEEKFYQAIFAEKAREGKNTSLVVPHGGAGIVIGVKRFSRKNGDEITTVGVIEQIKIYVAQKRKISEGDKMSGRHGNKGVISRILPVEDMPFLPDGTPIDIMLNPLGVPSRMNIGQILEVHLGYACKKLGIKVATPVFDGIDDEEIRKLMKEAKVDYKTVLYDGRTGERFDEKISVGVMYMIKLDHMVDDKLHARAIGPYSLVTQQPLGGKAQNGGQRFGEMEVWALEAYGAAHTLQEILTIKSDDRVGRNKTYESIIKQQKMPNPGIPEAFRVLTKELQALCIDVKLLNKDGEIIDMDALAKEVQQEERKSITNTRTLTSSEANNESSFKKDEDVEDDE